MSAVDLKASMDRAEALSKQYASLNEIATLRSEDIMALTVSAVFLRDTGAWNAAVGAVGTAFLMGYAFALGLTPADPGAAEPVTGRTVLGSGSAGRADVTS